MRRKWALPRTLSARHISRSVDQSGDGDGRGSISEQESLPAANTGSALCGSLCSHPQRGESAPGQDPGGSWQSRHKREGPGLPPSGQVVWMMHTKNWFSSWTRVLGVMKATQGAAVRRLEDRTCYGQKEAGSQGPLGRLDGAESREEQGLPRRRLAEVTCSARRWELGREWEAEASRQGDGEGVPMGAEAHPRWDPREQRALQKDPGPSLEQ